MEPLDFEPAKIPIFEQFTDKLPRRSGDHNRIRFG
jgi:hypothetical protein